MNSARKPNAMLIELVIVILFFAISAGIILQLFVSAHDRSRQSSVDTSALFAAEDVAGAFTASGQEADAFFQEAGFDALDNAYVSSRDAQGRTLHLRIDGASTVTDAGTLDSYTLSVYDGERLCVRLPVSRYLPKEGTP